MPTTKPAIKAASLTVAQLLERSAWFPLLDEAARERVRDEIREVEVAAGAALCRRGDTPLHWYGTLEGLLKWSITSSDGRSVTFGGLSVGSWFGEGTLLRGAPRSADVIALRPSRVAQLPLETFEWLHRTQRGFDHFLLQQKMIEAALRAVQPFESLDRQLGHAARPQRNDVGRARSAAQERAFAEPAADREPAERDRAAIARGDRPLQ